MTDYADAFAAARARANKHHRTKGDDLPFVLYRDIERTPQKMWLVENFLGAGELSCLFGAPGCGKSVLAGDLAAHVAAGWPWFGRRVMQGGVLHVAAERSALAKRRFAAFRLHHGLDDIPLAVVSGPIDLRNSHTDADKIIEAARRLEDETNQQTVLIEIDTVNRALAGGDENSSKDIGALIGNLARIQEATSAHVTLLHHVPHDQQRMRGHGALLAACDVTAHVENAGAFRTARVDKTNDGAEGETLAFTLISVELHHDPENGQITTAPIVQAVDGMTPKTSVNKGKLPKAAQIALRTLAEAVAEQGAPAQISNHIPEGVKTVTIDQWRHYAYRRGISAGEDRARQAAFKRAIEHLNAIGRVGIWDDLAWLV